MTVGIGMIGAGQMAHIHAVAIAEQEPGRARLVAVTSGSRAPALAAEFDAEAEPSIESLLDRPDIDAVVIATPHTAHLPNVLAAAGAGKHILLEKPMALDVDECRLMIDACDAAGVHLSLAKISRWLDAVRIGHELVAGGVAGDLVAVHVHRLFPGYPNAGWPLDPREGGAWLDWGSHGCDIVRWYAGREPELVTARFASRRTDMPDLTGMATFEFPGALLAHLFMSYEIPGAAATERAHYMAFGTDAVIDLHAYGGVDVLRGDSREPVYRDERFTDANTTWDEHAPYFRRGFAAQVRDLVEAIEDRRPPTIDGHDGLAAVAMATGALRSWREDSVVRL
ncbi:MAG: Gfo/Idh/MocA family oxidoreductase [Chloroflexi bacterium]|nr:Gfo/Idh/MocA family oxidoreductase [Chloroflexota bacterium]